MGSLRGGENVGSAEAEGQREALKKYTIDLTELARSGTLDPVIGSDDQHPGLFDAYRTALDALETAEGRAIDAAGIAGAWTLIGELGFAPALDACAACDAPLRSDAEVRFSHRLGGAVCEACSERSSGSRRLPPHARAAVAAWLEGGDPPVPSDVEARAHRRLLREFVQQHLGDGRSLRAFAVWEHGEWQAR